MATEITSQGDYTGFRLSKQAPRNLEALAVTYGELLNKRERLERQIANEASQTATLDAKRSTSRLARDVISLKITSMESALKATLGEAGFRRFRSLAQGKS